MLVENNFPADTRVRNEAFTLSAQGITVTVLALRGPRELPKEIVNGVTVYRIRRLTLFEKLPNGGASMARRLVRRLAAVIGYVSEYAYFTSACLVMSLYVAVRHGVDVIHAHNPPDTLVLVSATLKLFGTKSVFDHHDLSPELYLSRYKTTTSPITWALRVFERLSVKVADVVIATNDSYRAIDIARNGVDAAKVFVVRNGPDLTRVRLVATDSRLRGMNKTILGYVGAMNPQDGVDYLLRALRHLRTCLNRTDFYCVIIGDGDSRSSLEAMAVDLGVSEHVWFTGFVPDDEMVRYLSTADICLDPNPSSPLNDVSTWIKVMEYMALGKPVVSFDLKETRVSAGDAAIYVTPNDEAQFAVAIATLIDDPARCAEMGRRGQARVKTELGWHITSQPLLRAYELLLRHPLSSPGHTA